MSTIIHNKVVEKQFERERDKVTMRINPIVYLTIDIHDDLIGNNAVSSEHSFTTNNTSSSRELQRTTIHFSFSN